jgi:hypothetical protein
MLRKLSHTVCIAGLGAGMTEAIFAVTPSETIKYIISLNGRSVLTVVAIKDETY